MINNIQYIIIQTAAKTNLDVFISSLKESEVARRRFWDYLFDVDNFRKWKPECRVALFQEAWVDGFATLSTDKRAMALVTGVSMSLTLLPAIPLSLVLGTTMLWLPGLLISMAVIAASAMANIVGITQDGDITSERAPWLATR